MHPHLTTHSMRFPLYHRPNALIFLDDDASYLEMLAMVMPKNWYVRLYTHADECKKSHNFKTQWRGMKYRLHVRID
jgi:hypothetical protein